jgi:aryl-alcohol dehydrogenase-like predicted oxidoreductase
MAVMSYSPLAGGWLSGRWRKDAGQQTSSRAGRLPERFDLANPYNRRKLDAVESSRSSPSKPGSRLSSSPSGSPSRTPPSPRR